MSENLLENYCKKIDDLTPATFNEDQKILAKKILRKADERDLQNIFQMLIQRIKVGFTFDVAPTYQKEDEESVALLKKDEQRSFKNYENTSNIENTLIIGENYDALKNLLIIERERESSSHSDAYYDVIYIDPPYNTESAKDDGNHLADEKSDIAPSKFVYRDKFSRNGWLNMLNERLRLAKQLLKDDGVIFVSIDDNEQAYLKVLMDEIFGEENFVTNFIWQKKSGGGLNKTIYEGHEYIICYAKNKLQTKISEKNDSTKYFSKYTESGITYLVNKDIIRKNFGKKNDSFSHRNKAYEDLNSKQKLEWDIKINEGSYILVPFESEPGKHLVAKIYDSNSSLRKTPYSIIKIPFTIISGIWTKDGNYDIDSINITFDNPKPIQLIEHIISMKNNKNSRILDFYAGSGTTGHAVMELNKEDGGKRTYTLVTNNENNIGYDVCYERLYRVNNGIEANSETFEWIKKNKPYKQNLNVFSIDYYDTSILKKNDNDSIAKIKKALNKEIEEFGITPSSNFNVDIYYDLLSLKPIRGDITNDK